MGRQVTQNFHEAKCTFNLSLSTLRMCNFSALCRGNLATWSRVGNPITEKGSFLPSPLCRVEGAGTPYITLLMTLSEFQGNCSSLESHFSSHAVICTYADSVGNQLQYYWATPLIKIKWAALLLYGDSCFPTPNANVVISLTTCEEGEVDLFPNFRRWPDRIWEEKAAKLQSKWFELVRSALPESRFVKSAPRIWIPWRTLVCCCCRDPAPDWRWEP